MNYYKTWFKTTKMKYILLSVITGVIGVTLGTTILIVAENHPIIAVVSLITLVYISERNE